MSLINQMLQELDARRSDVPGHGPFGQQVRAVPDQRRIHPAWYVVLALAVVLSVVLAWVFTRPPVSNAPGSSAQLPLKLDPGLSLAPPAAQSPALPEGTGEVRATEKAEDRPRDVSPSAEAQRDHEKSDGDATTRQVVSAPKSAAVRQPVPVRAVKEPPSAGAMPEIAKVLPAATALLPTPLARKAEPVAAPVLNKQVKELNRQQRAENEYRKAALLLQQGKSLEAIGELEQALQLDPQHVGARQTLIGTLLEGKRPDEAVRRAREGLALDLAQPGLAMILARLQLDKSELRPAIETLERTLPYAGDRSDYQAFLAALLQRAEMHKQATEHYLQALRKSPQNGVWWMGLGISLQAEQRSAEAQEAFKRAKASNSLSPELTAFVDKRLEQLQR